MASQKQTLKPFLCKASNKQQSLGVISLFLLLAMPSIAIVLPYILFIGLLRISTKYAGQDNNEMWRVEYCWKQVRDKKIKKLEDCESYEPFFELQEFKSEVAENAATTLCNLSKKHLAYLKKEYSDSPRMIKMQYAVTNEHCAHPEVKK